MGWNWKYIAFLETNYQNEPKSEALDESSNFRFKSPLPPRLSSLPETSLPPLDITQDVTHSMVPRNDTDNIPLYNGCEDHWSWNPKDKSHEVRLNGPNSRIAHFHPNWSNGTAGVRGTRILNGGRYYWEINVSQRIFGTRYEHQLHYDISIIYSTCQERIFSWILCNEFYEIICVRCALYF